MAKVYIELILDLAIGRCKEEFNFLPRLADWTTIIV